MAYTERLSITVPDTLKDIAAKIGRGLDPDSGGADSFRDLGNGTINVTTPCIAEFKAQAEYMMTNPAMLHQVLQADYATRWADLTPPTLAECTLFCSSIIPEQEP